MSDHEDKKSKIIELFGNAAPPKAAPRKRTPPRSAASNSGNVIQINGDGVGVHQIVAGDINNITVTRAPRPRVVVTPGEGVVTDAQKAQISALRIEWVALHNSIKRRPLTDAAAWMKINAKARVTSYHLIPLERFDAVIAYIRREMAMLRAMPSAPSSDDTWRTKRIAAIKVRCKNQLGDPDAYKPYIKKKFGVESLADLATDELQSTYTYIMAKKAPAQ